MGRLSFWSMTVINSKAGPSTVFPSKSEIDTSSCVDGKIQQLIILSDDGVHSNIHNTYKKQLQELCRWCLVITLDYNEEVISSSMAIK